MVIFKPEYTYGAEYLTGLDLNFESCYQNYKLISLLTVWAEIQNLSWCYLSNTEQCMEL